MLTAMAAGFDSMGIETPRHPSTLDGAVTGVLLQFSFADRTLVPPSLWNRDVVTLVPQERSKMYLPGTKFIPTTFDVGIKAFLFEFADANYDLTFAESRMEQDPRPEHRGQNVYRVQYVFRRIPHDEVPQSAEYAKLDKYFLPALQLLAKCNWVMRAYTNPHIADCDKFGMSVTCENFGTTPMKRPSHFLRVEDGKVVVE